MERMKAEFVRRALGQEPERGQYMDVKEEAENTEVRRYGMNLREWKAEVRELRYGN